MMSKAAWFYHRLRAMSIPEVGWRAEQRLLQEQEKKRFGAGKLPVTDHVFNPALAGLQCDPRRLHLNLSNPDYSLKTEIPLLGDYPYSEYKTRWHAGFQTENDWPLSFCYDLDYKQRDDVGDARTNWELNKHFQFVLLAKNYRASGDRRYLEELETLFEDWNRRNPFLWGISWTSIMEFGIRCSNWCYTYCFLKGLEGTDGLCEKLRVGILNMADYVSRHYSRYSSANNHLIVEIYSVCQVGILFGYPAWEKLGVDIITRELPRQNYPDGVNRELALHYQSFCMEPIGLLMRLLVKNGREVPQLWRDVLPAMCGYVADCRGSFGEVAAFGDSDGGKIVDLEGGYDHIAFTQALFSCLLDRRYAAPEELELETLRWLFTPEELAAAVGKPAFPRRQFACYRIGGNTMLHSRDGRILIGMDHAALGFGHIAAHGHADALSFQLLADGVPVFADPGTYIYHCDLEARNLYRRTENHNTVCVGDKDQSEMLGAFLWGRKANCRLLDYREENGGVFLRACHDGYGESVERSLAYDGQNRLVLRDSLPEGRHFATFVLGPGFEVKTGEREAWVTNGSLRVHMRFETGGALRLESGKKRYSAAYGTEETTDALTVFFSDTELETELTLCRETENGTPEER